MTERDAFEVRFAAAVHGYVGRVSSELDPVELAHRIAASEPRRHGLAAALAWRTVAIPRAAWVLLLLGALLAALVGTALVASLMRETAPRVPPLGAALVPTGIEVLTPETGRYARVVADGDGFLWAREQDGRLVQFDPSSGSAQAWTIGDDAAFEVTTSSGFDIVAARDIGVWVVGPRTLRWFDGAVLREEIVAPAEIAVAAEAPDGSLWAATTDGAVLHWDGSSWSMLDPGRPNPDAFVNVITVDTGGRLWLGWDSGLVARYDGSSWTTFDGKDATRLGGPVWTITQFPDGAVWVASAGGLARFDGSSWTGVEWPPGNRTTASVAGGTDGAIWFAAGDPGDGAVTVGRFDGHSWVSYGPPDGLPGALESGFVTAWALPTQEGAYVGTGAGIYRLADGRWERAWPKDPSPAIDLEIVLAVSRDELWAIDLLGGLWHVRGGAWTRESIDPRHPEGGVVRALTLAPDGTLWAAGSDGVGYRRDERWTIADAGDASAITVDRGGTTWVGGGSGEECEVWTLRFEDTSWVSRAVAGCPPESFGLSSLAIDTSGGLWAGTAAGCAWGMSGCTPGWLARLDGGSWEAIRELGGFELTSTTIRGTTPAGDVWIVDDPGDARGATGKPAPITAARFDGTSWTAVVLPDGFMPDIAVEPDGRLWAWTWWVPSSTGGDRGPAHYDGAAWTFPYDGAGLPWMKLAAVAPDGAVFGEIASSIFRFPDQAPPP